MSGSETAAEPAAPKDNGLALDPSLSDDEKRFYAKAYPTVDLVRDRKVHCTTCKGHIGTAPIAEDNLKMHPILRVTHCNKCHDFYNSGEFSKGEDGSELYCRWCGQGGEVYCCSNCPYVFCKSCIVKNLSRGVVADIEQNENWSCFSCAPKILWPLRAQHWALINYIDKQKKAIEANRPNLTETDYRAQLAKDQSTCCRLAKAKCGNMSDSNDSLDSALSRRSGGSSSAKKSKVPPSAITPPAAKKPKNNDEVVCTPDLLSMLEPDCQITLSNKSGAQRPANAPANMQSPSNSSSPRVFAIQQGYGQQKNNNTPPPLVLRTSGVHMRPMTPAPMIRRAGVGPRNPAPTQGVAPVYHTINGYRIDLNSAAQQETFRLPNGKLIQVKRQGTQQTHQNSNSSPVAAATPTNNWQQQQQQHAQQRILPQMNRPVQISQSPYGMQQQITAQPSTTTIRFHNQMVGNTTVRPLGHNGNTTITPIQVVNGTPMATTVQTAHMVPPGTTVRPFMIRQVFPTNPIGKARTQLQDQVFNAMEICQHLTGKVQTLTNSNAYKQARNYLEVKELYIHLSYLLTYAIGRFKGLQDKCLGDMRQLGFNNDADSLENGQLAAGVDYVRYGQLEEIDLFNTGSNSFHNQIYEYRKSLHDNMDPGPEGIKEPLSPLMPFGSSFAKDNYEYDVSDNYKGMKKTDDYDDENMDDYTQIQVKKEPLNDSINLEEDEQVEQYEMHNAPHNELFDNDVDDNDLDADDVEADADGDADEGSLLVERAYGRSEELMQREEQTHAIDRKLTRLIEQFPAIWCTRHPDYGNFEVTRRQWNYIGTHFKKSDNLKLRWKNIRKRFVRIERRTREGKRFNGYFDKGTNFLSNRDLPESEWLEVDKGHEEGESYDNIDNEVAAAMESNEFAAVESMPLLAGNDNAYDSVGPALELQQLDMRIINFVKCNQSIYRKLNEAGKNEEQTRRMLWTQFARSVPNCSVDDIIDRWMQLYEMYKTFRLKTIKNTKLFTNLELKYSKYLAKLYFLYKIDEDELRNESIKLEDWENINDLPDKDTQMLEMQDDKDFVLQLVRAVRECPALWDQQHSDFSDKELRKCLWEDVAATLGQFNRDMETIKLRWQLAKFSYKRFMREFPKWDGDTDGDDKLELPKYCRNLPLQEMKTFLFPQHMRPKTQAVPQHFGNRWTANNNDWS